MVMGLLSKIFLSEEIMSLSDFTTIVITGIRFSWALIIRLFTLLSVRIISAFRFSSMAEKFSIFRVAIVVSPVPVMEFMQEEKKIRMNERVINCKSFFIKTIFKWLTIKMVILVV